jgi:uncharacterized protein (DUF2267 family)
MTWDELAERVALHAGLDRDGAERALTAVASVLGQRLGRPEAEALAGELPAACGAALLGAAFDGAFDRDDFVARVAAREGVAAGFAIEHVVAVLGAIGEAASQPTLARLEHALGAELFAPFTTHSAAAAPAAAPHVGGGHTLADGRPGSRHPLSEAAPPAGQSESVARSAAPHAATKLSTAHGLTQEREHEDLKSGRPGASRPLSEKQR